MRDSAHHAIKEPAARLKLAVVRRLHKQPPQFQIVPEKAIMLFEDTMRKSARGLNRIEGFWARAEFIRRRVLKRTAAGLRGPMARWYSDYTAAMLRGEMATIDDDGAVRKVDDNIELSVRSAAYAACSASLQ